MKIYPCGTEVTIRQGERKGIIIEICIRYSHVQYNVRYQDSTAYIEKWFWEEELDFCNVKPVSIGFKI
jgi:hypothetical protein